MGLSISVYLAGINKSLSLFSVDLYDDSLSDDTYAACLASLTKYIHMDTSIVIHEIVQIQHENIEQQSQAMMAMSTPVTMIWEGVLMLPIVGILDSKRAQDLMHSVLNKIADTRSKVIILDVSGVAVVDTAVANHVIKITKATKLMGCECIISGVSPAIAQTMVELGIDVGSISTTSTLRDALELAFSSIGVSIVEQQHGI